MQLTFWWVLLLLAAASEEEAWCRKGSQAEEDSRAGRWAGLGQSAMMTTGAAGAASNTCKPATSQQSCLQNYEIAGTAWQLT